MPLHQLSDAAERISDLLTMLGVDPNERQVEDVHGVDTPMGETVAEIIARAALGNLPARLTDAEKTLRRIEADLEAAGTDYQLATVLTLSQVMGHFDQHPEAKS